MVAIGRAKVLRAAVKIKPKPEHRPGVGLEDAVAVVKVDRLDWVL